MLSSKAARSKRIALGLAKAIAARAGTWEARAAVRAAANGQRRVKSWLLAGVDTRAHTFGILMLQARGAVVAWAKWQRVRGQDELGR